MPKIIVKVPPSKTEQTVTIDVPDSISVPASSVTAPAQSVSVPASTVPVPATSIGTPVITGTTPLDPVTVPPVVIPPTSGYTTTYTNGYDKDSDLDHVHEQLGKGVVSTTVTKNSPGSFKGIVNIGDPSISSGFRSENQYNDAAQNPKEGSVEFDFLLESLTPVLWGGDCCQWHPGGNDNGGSALFFMEVAQQKWNMYCWKKGYYDSYGKPTAITLNKWYHIRHEFNWSLNADGYWKVYIDGALYWSYTGATQISNDQPYFKLGFNFFSASSNQKTSVHGGVGYWDNLVIQKKN